MNREGGAEEGRAVLWHNFYGSEQSQEDDIVREFEENAKLLRERANGNVLYHEILAFSGEIEIPEKDLYRMVADIGQEYLRSRAPSQLAYGVIHRDTDHVHLHLMISSNAIGKESRVRLSKEEFSNIQKQIEYFAITRFPELGQSKIYDRPRGKEKLKTQTHEQAMKARTKAPSRKESIKGKLHNLFEHAKSRDELWRLAENEGLAFYERGKSIGVIERGLDGSERRHRLSSLGLEAHYDLTTARFLSIETRTADSARAERMQDDRSSDQVRMKGEGGMEREDANTRRPRQPLESEQKSPTEQEIDDLLSRIPGLKAVLPKEERPPNTPRDRADRGDRGRDDDER